MLKSVGFLGTLSLVISSSFPMTCTYGNKKKNMQKTTAMMSLMGFLMANARDRDMLAVFYMQEQTPIM